MNLEIAWGRILQIVGKARQLWGTVTGDELGYTRGYQMVVIGQMRVLGGRAAALVRYCTPRQALEIQPAPVRALTRPGSRIRVAGRAP
jgi:uncharacterized protein YjbJ (UPF0337 family)